MIVLVYVLVAVLYLLLVLLESGKAARTTVSLYELRRRRADGDSRSAEVLKREKLLAQAGALKQPLKGLLIISLLLVLVHVLGRVEAILVTVIAVLCHERLARLAIVRRFSNKIYAKYENRLLDFIDRYEKFLRVIVGKNPLSQPTAPLGSRQELVHLLDISTIFSEEDKKLLGSVIGFSDLLVSDVMTKKASLVTVPPDELLGPLVLDDLHKTKHEIFPVEKGGDIVGMLDIRDHIALKRKESVYARDVMHAGVVRIAASEPLDEALRVLIAAKQPYLIVTDDDGKVVGMLGLGDVIRALTGWNRR